MDQVIFQAWGLVVTPWKLIGYLGTFLFAGRWFVQMAATRKHRRVHMPLAFWWMSIIGSLMALSYFVFGKNDSVGILQNAFPALVATYNLLVEYRTRRQHADAPPRSD
ncbi:MAG: lipid-A-disaccharide synthase N-terminal domain-containing protein [Metallibacterium scheffleri]|jgi:lipid-A-disaccharide synthase-like uncharacterized protein|uniref:Lipid A biosynthesis acyltransferase n=1 Tax=Metallibacterium scheffleri TaxID=993689 RepID=A0A4S3KG53_9GAMM|nr:lipid-A-disaccharide synthase N-terminal domain-containing protein [Metallibacterium scheffleri]MCK9368069.1 lipid-A-disaccharide synthase N-terminal domain-containing protein [Metallibacterium scheffleri]THD07556.1 lipid A biosynthesis acyltransferase [Metallibacterium scheffleri]